MHGQIFEILANFVCLAKGLNVTLVLWQYFFSAVGATIFSAHMLLFLRILVHFTTLRALFEFLAQTHFFLSLGSL